MLTAVSLTGVQAWRQRGRLTRYPVRSDAAEGCFQFFGVIPFLLNRWTTGPIDELNDDLVAMLFDQRDVRRISSGQLDPLEYGRGSKLALDAARELYHLAAFAHFGVFARYEPTADVQRGVDLAVAMHGEPEYLLQIGMRRGGKTTGAIDRMKDRRGHNTAGAIPIIFDSDRADRTKQPFVPHLEDYQRVIRELWPHD